MLAFFGDRGQGVGMGLVRYTVDRGIATVTLDSPQNRNALSAQLMAELSGAFDGVRADPAVRGVVLTHASTTFCAGADLSGGGDPAEGLRSLLDLLRQIVTLPKPVTALIRGHVRAGGMGLAAACDIAIATQDSTFAFTEARLGLAPAVVSLAVLPRLTDRAAARYFLTGEVFGAQDAVSAGLLTGAPADVDAELRHIADGIRKCSPQGLMESKTLTAKAIGESLAGAGEQMIALSARLFTTEEAAEGMVSFLQRRTPAWVT